MLEAVILDKVISPNEVSSAVMVQRADEASQGAAAASEMLFRGNAIIPPVTGFDEEIDAINIKNACFNGDNDTSYHDTYKCSSAVYGFLILDDIIQIVKSEVLTDDNNLGKFAAGVKVIPHAIHLANRHLWICFEKTVNRLEVIHAGKLAALDADSAVFLVCGFICTILHVSVVLVVYFKSKEIYQTAMIVLQRLPPSAFATHKQLLDFVLSRGSQNEQTEMSIAQSTFHLSSDAILCTGISGVIEIVNPSVTEVVGYTPDQLLGQNVRILFCESDAEKIDGRMKLMLQGQSSRVFECSVSCLADTGEPLNCLLTLLAMSEGSADKNPIESFVIIMRDQTELAKQQEEAATAKAKSEQLLFQILPRSIVIRLSQGETDISFSVPQASIIFVDVVKFSEYSALLSPPEIMGNLSKLFATFDAAAKKYSLLTKIKLIGDIYMAASGLFAGEDQPPNDHAIQIVNFGLDCIANLDDVNQVLNASLQVRVGVNSGGPVLAGVLGTDKPVFDIIGDTINVAARLQTTDVPGNVHIPQSTFELIQNGDFKIERRGETFLKGKGKTMTYLVTSVTAEHADSARAESGIGLIAASLLPKPTGEQQGRAPPSCADE
jgi:PAS domain S-box-containing protein